VLPRWAETGRKLYILIHVFLLWDGRSGSSVLPPELPLLRGRGEDPKERVLLATNQTLIARNQYCPLLRETRGYSPLRYLRGNREAASQQERGGAGSNLLQNEKRVFGEGRRSQRDICRFSGGGKSSGGQHHFSKMVRKVEHILELISQGKKVHRLKRGDGLRLRSEDYRKVNPHNFSYRAEEKTRREDLRLSQLKSKGMVLEGSDQRRFQPERRSQIGETAEKKASADEGRGKAEEKMETCRRGWQ